MPVVCGQPDPPQGLLYPETPGSAAWHNDEPSSWHGWRARRAAGFSPLEVTCAEVHQETQPAAATSHLCALSCAVRWILQCDDPERLRVRCGGSIGQGMGFGCYLRT